MKNEVVIHSENDLQSRIYTIRGLPVMLDFDLAEIYGYEVKRLNEQVKRNISRFPDDFMFQLTKYEVEILKSQIATSREHAILKSQIVTSSENNDLVKSQFVTSPEKEILMSQNATSSWGGVRKLPYAFTEQGIYMLATVLRGELAEQQSIFIMRAFRELKHYVQENLQFVTRNEMQLLYKTATEKAFHCGASSKDAGRKVCAINRFEDATMVYPVVDKLLSQKDLILN